MSDYRDFGQTRDMRTNQTQGLTFPSSNSEVIVDTDRKGQVYQATHSGDGVKNRLPHMNRSFISFSYSDVGQSRVYIEDFNLIATIQNDRWEREGYTTFTDSITTYDNLDGQYYWGTHYRSHTIIFKLATDGMNQNDLDKFLNWFQAGVSRELILSEHPNRAQMARVAEPPQLSLLPFETTINMTIKGVQHPIITTLYKGEITLKLVMDNPHWYSLQNILGKKQNDNYIDSYTDANGTEVQIFSSPDALKILYEDGIPLGSMISNNMLLGNGAFANIAADEKSCIWKINGAQRAYYDDIQWSGGSPRNGTPTGYGARIEDNNVTYPYQFGYIWGAIVNASGKGITDLPTNSSNSPSNENVGYFFYSGTAPAPTCLNFYFTPTISMYVTTPANSYAPNGSGTNAKAYSTVTIGSQTQQELQFTTPNLLTSFNKAIKIIDDDKPGLQNGQSWENTRKHIREQVRHLAVRQWAIAVLNYGEAKGRGPADMIFYMSYFLKDGTNNHEVYPMKCSFNSETGEAYGWFYYRTIPKNATMPQNDSDWASFGTIPTKNVNTWNNAIKEDIGDMIRSNYLTIKDRNYFNDTGHVTKWTSSHKEYSHYVYHNFNVSLKDLSIIYKNMYL